MEAQIEVPVHLDQNGEGWQQVYGSPASLTILSQESYGPQASVTVEPVEGAADRACIYIKGGEPNQIVALLANQTLPE